MKGKKASCVANKEADQKVKKAENNVSSLIITHKSRAIQRKLNFQIILGYYANSK